MKNGQTYARLATAIAVLTLLGMSVKTYDRFVTVEAMAVQAKSDIESNKGDVSEDIREIKETLIRMDSKIDKALLK